MSTPRFNHHDLLASLHDPRDRHCYVHRPQLHLEHTLDVASAALLSASSSLRSIRVTLVTPTTTAKTPPLQP